MIKTIDLLEISSPVEQSEQLGERMKRRLPPVNLAPLGRQPETQADDGRLRRDAACRIEKALAYMLANLNRPVQIAAVSKIAGMSASHFYFLFKTATGSTPNDFFIRARMHRACGLLQETNLRVKEIAAALGYQDQFYFSRVFKSVSAVPPVRYRNLNLSLQRRIKDLLDPQTISGECRRQIPPGRLAVDVHLDCSFPAPQSKTETKQPNRKNP